MSGHFITFEGIDGCGKTTQRRLTAEWLRDQGVEVVETFEPGDTALGREIRSLLLDGTHVPAAETELLLFLADRTQHLRELILPAMERGAVVLCDRFTDSTRAYQLAGRTLDAARLEAMLRTAELGTPPELTLWFDLPVADAQARVRQRVKGGEAATRLDDEVHDFHERVRAGFAGIHAADSARVRRVDASCGVDEVQQQVRTLLQPLLKGLPA